MESWQDAIRHTQPEQTAEREALYFRMRVLDDVLSELAGFVHMARSLSDRELEAEELAQQAQSAYLSG